MLVYNISFQRFKKKVRPIWTHLFEVTTRKQQLPFAGYWYGTRKAEEIRSVGRGGIPRSAAAQIEIPFRSSRIIDSDLGCAVTAPVPRYWNGAREAEGV